MKINNTLIALSIVLPTLVLVACHSTTPALTWGEKTARFKDTCLALGHEEGCGEYLACIESEYQKALKEAVEQERRRQRAEYDAKHNSVGLWKKNQVGGVRISDGPITQDPTTTHGISWPN